MADISEVKPGDLITADQVNEIIRRLNSLGEAAGGTVTVPNVFGRTLADAKGLILMQGSLLQVGAVLDASGVSLDPDATPNAMRAVLFQMPVAGQLVTPGAAVNLVVAGSTIVAPLPKPTITGFDPAKVPMTTMLRIHGTGFDVDMGRNSVTFDGIPGTIISAQSSIVSLAVTVPDGIPNVPTSGNGEKPVTVVVKAPGGDVTVQVPVQPKPVNAPPSISSIVAIGSNPNAPIAIGAEVVINGDNFGDNFGADRVLFDDSAVVPVEGSATFLRVTVPAIAGLEQSGSTKGVVVIVERSGVRSAGVGRDFQKL